MAYNINKTDGTNLVTIADGSSDTNYTSITLFGKNYAGYGELLNENAVKMLENFAYSSPPANPLQGQLWWDTVNKLLKVRKDAEWKVVGPKASMLAPTSDVVGDLWWDETNSQLNIYNGANWTVVGPAFTAQQGLSGPIVATVHGAVDNTDHIITKFYVSGVVVAILSKDNTFEINTIPGFTHIKPGFNLPITGTYTYYGNAENALSLGNVLAANYLRSDVASTTNFPLSVKTNSGLNIGLNDDFKIEVENNATSFKGITGGRNTDFYVNVGGTSTLALRINAASGLVTVFADPTSSLGVATKNYVDTSITTSANTLLRRDGSTSITGNLSPTVTGVYSLGSDINHFAQVHSDLFHGTTFVTETGILNSLQINDAPSTSLSATNKQYVDAVVANLSAATTTLNNNTINTLIGTTAPPTLSNLSAISAAIGNNPTYAADHTVSHSLLAPLNSPTLTGTPIAPTPATNDTSTKIATTAFVKSAITDATSALTGGNPVFTGNTTVDALIVTQGITTPTNNSIDIGSPLNSFRNVYGTSMKANYADLAENYVADAEYEPGTVLDFGGAHEVTISTGYVATRVAGVVSTDPAYLMNAGCTGHFVASVALQGRCPVKAIGPIQKGDLLVPAGDGKAKAAVLPTVGSVIGKSLEDLSSKEGIIEVAIGRC